MISSFVRTVSGVLGGAALFCVLGAATCEGTATVRVSSGLPAGQCGIVYPFDVPAPGNFNDVLQVAGSSNVNDFFPCQIVSVATTNLLITEIVVSSSDARAHPFAVDGATALVFNLSR